MSDKFNVDTICNKFFPKRK